MYINIYRKNKRLYYNKVVTCKKQTLYGIALEKLFDLKKPVG